MNNGFQDSPEVVATQTSDFQQQLSALLEVFDIERGIFPEIQK